MAEATKAAKRKRPHSQISKAADEGDSSDEYALSDEEGSEVDGIYIPPPAKPHCSFDPKGPRLLITKIVNNFFKSYAEEVVLGPFHKCFNAIVGPNGSGKSNVIDSILFVFGYRATKIRSKKISVLIHNSEGHTNVQSASVEIHFALGIDKEGDKYDVVPKSEFVVSRTVNKDSSSFYQLNGKRVQFKEIGTLLKSHGIDLSHNRFLILQGEVEQIAMMKCKAENENESGLLEYLEDIIGTTRYKKPLEQLNERVEVLSDVRLEKVNRLKLVENEMKELEGPMEEAVEFLKAENTIVVCKNFFYQKNIYELGQKAEKVEVDHNTVQSKYKELEEKLSETTSKKEEKEQELAKEKEKYHHLVKKKDAMKEAFDKANNKDVQLQAEMVQINKNRKKTKDLLLEEQKKLEKLHNLPAESEKAIAECQQQEEKLLLKKDELQKQKIKLLSSLKSETRELQEKKEVLETKLVTLQKKVDETKSGLSLAESELDICQSNETNEREKLETMQNSYKATETLIAERSQAVASLKKKIPATEASLTSAVEELNTVKQQELQLQNEIRKRKTSLEEFRSSMQASKSRNKVLNALMEQKAQGNCPGLFGRLGDLGGISKKYDVAISTACGALDNLLVDTVSTAEWCLKFLKQYDVGRATFIILEKQEHLRQLANTAINTPEDVPRLFDLVQVQDERFKTAFYFALRNTLVADNLDQACRIAYGAQRYRVVTLDGGLIETSGTMSGGGKTVSKGRMGQSVAVATASPQEFGKLEQQVEKLESQIRELRERQISLEKQIAALEPELRQMKTDYKKFTVELQSLQQQQPILAKQLKEQQAKCKSTKSDPAQVAKLKKIVDKRKADYDEAYEAAQEIQVEVDALTQQIQDKTRGKMHALDKELKEVTKTIDKCKAEITRLQVALKTADRNTKKAVEKIKNMEQEISDSETKLRQMKAERDQIEEDAQKLLTCIDEFVGQITEMEDRFAGAKEEIGELTKRANKLKSYKVDEEQKLKAVKKEISDIKATMHDWNVKISRLQLQDIPNESVQELKKYTHEEIEQENAASMERELKSAENLVKSTKPNLEAIQTYRKKQEQFMLRSKELEEISVKRNEVKGTFDRLRTQRKQEFLTGFNIIKKKLKEMYQMITLGGDADFDLLDTFDPFTEGVQFNVRPPKKSWKKISNLSGGEKTLSSLALVFALHYYKPSPLYIMDEIDAALDSRNVSIVANYIKERTKNAQFIIISLRSNMFELADNLIGIYKIYNCTYSISYDPRLHSEEEKEDEAPPANTQNEIFPETEKNKSKSSVTGSSNRCESGTESSEMEIETIQNVVVNECLPKTEKNKSESSVTGSSKRSESGTESSEMEIETAQNVVINECLNIV